MGEWKVVSVIIGIIGALFGVYLRETVRLAYNQKAIASRLNAYLLYWQRIILEEDMFDLTVLGMKWHDDYMKALQSGSTAEELAYLDKKYEATLKNMKEAIEKGDPLFAVNEEQLNQKLAKMEHIVGELIETIKISRQNMIDAKTYISDEEAGLLGYYVSANVIELKLRIISLMDCGHLLLHVVQTKKSISLQEHADEIYRLIRATIIVSKCMEVVKDRNEFFRKQTIGNLVWKNMTDKL